MTDSPASAPDPRRPRFSTLRMEDLRDRFKGEAEYDQFLALLRELTGGTQVVKMVISDEPDGYMFLVPHHMVMAEIHRRRARGRADATGVTEQMTPEALVVTIDPALYANVAAELAAFALVSA